MLKRLTVRLGVVLFRVCTLQKSEHSSPRAEIPHKIRTLSPENPLQTPQTLGHHDRHENGELLNDDDDHCTTKRAHPVR